MDEGTVLRKKFVSPLCEGLEVTQEAQRRPLSRPELLHGVHEGVERLEQVVDRHDSSQ